MRWQQQRASVMSLGGRNETVMPTSDLVTLCGAASLFLLG